MESDLIDVEQPAPELDSDPANPDAGNPSPEATEADPALLAQQAEEAEIEEELEGVKLRGKKDALERIKAERLMQADYTRKTQEVAEQRKTFEQERTQFQEAAKSHQEHIREVGRLMAIDERLQQFQQVNWQQLNTEDPVRAQALLIEFNQLQAARGQLTNSLAQKEQRRQSAAQQESAKRANEAEAIVMREVRDWGPEKLAKFSDAATKAGMPAGSVQQMLIQYPQAARFLNKALMYDQLLASRMQKPAPTPAPPASRVGGGSASNAKPLGDITDPREYREARNRRLGRIT